MKLLLHPSVPKFLSRGLRPDPHENSKPEPDEENPGKNRVIAPERKEKRDDRNDQSSAEQGFDSRTRLHNVAAHAPPVHLRW